MTQASLVVALPTAPQVASLVDKKGEDILKLTKTGYQLTDFYPSNDTDVVHFRWLHHALRLADNLTISSSSDYYTQSNHYQTHHSDYASTTYDQTITTRNQAGHETKHTIKPYIDDQLAEHFRQVIKPELDALTQRCDALEQQNERQQNEINELTQRVNTLENNVENRQVFMPYIASDGNWHTKLVQINPDGSVTDVTNSDAVN